MLAPDDEAVLIDESQLGAQAARRCVVPHRTGLDPVEGAVSELGEFDAEL